jgi:hypothetical protein
LGGSLMEVNQERKLTPAITRCDAWNRNIVLNIGTRRQVDANMRHRSSITRAANVRPCIGK